jgi:hypothetical protein
MMGIRVRVRVRSRYFGYLFFMGFFIFVLCGVILIFFSFYF